MKNELFASVSPVNIEFNAFLIASATARQNEIIKEAIDSTECQFDVELFPRTVRLTNEESGERFAISIDDFCDFMVNHGGFECEIAFDLWLEQSLDCELAQWAEAFVLAEDAIQEYRAEFGYNYKVSYERIYIPRKNGAAPAPFPEKAPDFAEGEQDGDEPTQVPLFI